MLRYIVYYQRYKCDPFEWYNAVKAIWLIWLIAWSGRLMATISSAHDVNGMGICVRGIATLIPHNQRQRRFYITFDRVDKKYRIVHAHTNWIYGNVFNVLCIFAYYLWSSIFETSVICDVIVACNVCILCMHVWLLFFIHLSLSLISYFLCSAFHSFWLANIRILFAVHISTAHIQCIYY